MSCCCFSWAIWSWLDIFLAFCHQLTAVKPLVIHPENALTLVEPRGELTSGHRPFLASGKKWPMTQGKCSPQLHLSSSILLSNFSVRHSLVLCTWDCLTEKLLGLLMTCMVLPYIGFCPCSTLMQLQHGATKNIMWKILCFSQWGLWCSSLVAYCLPDQWNLMNQ